MFRFLLSSSRCFIFFRSGQLVKQQLSLRPGQLRVYSQDARGSFSRQAVRRRTLKETMMAPSEGTAISAGKMNTRAIEDSVQVFALCAM